MMGSFLENEGRQAPGTSNANVRPLILGVSVFGHDSSCALVDAEAGDILYALTEERFSNLKHDGGYPVASIALLRKRIDAENLGRIEYIGLNIDPTISIGRLEHELAKLIDVESVGLLMGEFDQLITSADIFHPNYFPLNYFEALLARRGIVSEKIAQVSEKFSWYGNFFIRHKRLTEYMQSIFPEAKLISIGHHQCHAASTFYCSNFEGAAILTIDGQGEDETITMGLGKGNKIETLSSTRWPNSLGALYMQLAWYLGFDGDTQRYRGFGDEYKVMGMAAYGRPIYIDVFREMGKVNVEGKFEFIVGKYIELVPVEGCPGHSEPVLTEAFFNILGSRRAGSAPIEQRHYDIACSGQLFLEEIGVAIAKHLRTLSAGIDNLCIAGGVGLNGLMNMKIFREAGFRDIFIQPASGDDGTSLGAALYLYHNVLEGTRCRPLSNAYLGLTYDDDIVRATLEKYNLKFHVPNSIHSEMGRLLHEGKIVARYFGRGEFGPRALGHRSILANPILPEMKNAVNEKIKHRESFRPFAPACLEERAAEYFDIDTPTPYMLLICQTRSEARMAIPAVVHDDGTARLQTVNKDLNPDFYQIITAFDKNSGVPILLNTSFNVNGEAIVETPQDAVESFLFMGIDYLAIGPYLVSKIENESAYTRPTRADHIETRQERYRTEFFSPEMFLRPAGNPIETDLVLLKKQVEMYKDAAELRLNVIEQLDAEIQRIDKRASKSPIEMLKAFFHISADQGIGKK